MHDCCPVLKLSELSHLLLWNVQAETSVSTLQIDGRSCRLFRNQQAHAAAEAREGLIPWNGDADNIIDRFDGRALLDFYRDPDELAKHQKSESELELDEVTACLCLQHPSLCACTASSYTHLFAHTLTSCWAAHAARQV